MPRRPREEEAGAVHHVFARGNDRGAIFWGDRDRVLYLEGLAETVSRTGWRVLAYALMDNHVHLLIETPEPNLGVGMRAFHGRYAQQFNKRHPHTGHVFQGRYGSKRAKDDAQLWTTAAYIALNPVRAGRCARPEDWPWSSHAVAVAGGTAAANTAAARAASTPFDADRLLHYFAGVGGDPLANYVDYVAGWDAADRARNRNRNRNREGRPKRERFLGERLHEQEHVQ